MYVAANVIFFIILPSPETEFNQKKKRRGPELHCNLRAKVFFLQFFTFPLRRSFVSSLNHKSITVLGLSFCHSFLVFSNYFLFVDSFRRTFNSPSSCVFHPVFFFQECLQPLPIHSKNTSLQTSTPSRALKIEHALKDLFEFWWGWACSSLCKKAWRDLMYSQSNSWYLSRHSSWVWGKNYANLILSLDLNFSHYITKVVHNVRQYLHFYTEK